MNTWFQLLLYLIGIWGGLLVLDRVFHLRRFDIEVSPLSVLIKTRRINNFITRVGSKHPWFWKGFYSLGSATGIVVMGYAFYFMGSSFFGLLFNQPGAQAIAPILPGINVRFSTLPYILVALILSLTSHELSHGIAAVAEHIPIKSAGVFLFILFPGGFVEIDEAHMLKRSPTTRLRVFSAGVFSNLLMGLVVVLLISAVPLALAPFYSPQSNLLVVEVEAGSPAEGLLAPYSIIYSINGTLINDYTEFTQFMALTHPNQVLALETNLGIIEVTTAVHPTNSTRGYLGLLTNNLEYTPRAEFPFISPVFPFILNQMLLWVFIISISLGVINLLPIPFFDGDRFIENILEYYIPTLQLSVGGRTLLVRRLLHVTARVASLVFLLGSIVLTFISFGTLPMF